MSGPQPAPRDEDILAVLQRRDGVPTTVMLADGGEVLVFNIAWGYDIGDAYAHVTTNFSPRVEGTRIDFFYTSAVTRMVDPLTRGVLYEQA
jgi:hypothetical protein